MPPTAPISVSSKDIADIKSGAVKLTVEPSSSTSKGIEDIKSGKVKLTVDTGGRGSTVNNIPAPYAPTPEGKRAYNVNVGGTTVKPYELKSVGGESDNIIRVGGFEARTPSDVMGRTFFGGSVIKAPVEQVVKIGSRALTGLGTKSIYQGAEQIIPKAGGFVLDNIIPGAAKEFGKRLGLGTGLIAGGEALGRVGVELPGAGRGLVAGITNLTGERKGLEETLDSPGALKADTELYNSINQSYFGGVEQTVDESGKIIKSDKKEGVITNPVQSFVYGLPMVDLIDPTRRNENEALIREKIRETNDKYNPKFKELSESDKDRFVNVKFKEEYVGGKTGAFFGTVAIETGSELQGAGMLTIIPGSGGGKVVNVVRSGTTGGIIGGLSEAPKSIELQERTERTKYTDEEKLMAQGVGALSGAFFMGFSTAVMPEPKIKQNITNNTVKTTVIPDSKKGLKDLAGEAIEFVGTAPPFGDIGEPFGNLGRSTLQKFTGKDYLPVRTFIPVSSKTTTRTTTEDSSLVKLTEDAGVGLTDRVTERLPSGRGNIRTNTSVPEGGSDVPIPPKIPDPIKPDDEVSPIDNKVDVKIDTRLDYESRVPIRIITPVGGAPLIPFIGGDDFGGKQSKRERTRFVDEFSIAFAGLAKPSQPTYFGKQSSIAKTRKMFKPKKPKRTKRPGGFNYEALFV